MLHPQPGLPSDSEQITIAISSMKSLTRVLHLVWKVEEGNISSVLQDVRFHIVFVFIELSFVFSRFFLK